MAGASTRAAAKGAASARAKAGKENADPKPGGKAKTNGAAPKKKSSKIVTSASSSQSTVPKNWRAEPGFCSGATFCCCARMSNGQRRRDILMTHTPVRTCTL